MDFLARLSPDVVTLQETRPSTHERWRDAAVADLGLPHVLSSLETAHSRLPRQRRLGVFMAARHPLSSDSRDQIQSPWPEKALSARLESPIGSIDLHAVYVPPGSSNGWVKVEVLESIFEALSHDAAYPRILVGDFNAPQAELPSGGIITWGQRQRSDGSYVVRRSKKGRPAERWDLAERNVLEGLAAFGMRDAFRSTHGFEKQAWSWVMQRKEKSWPRRFDHCLVSRAIDIDSIEYLQEAREVGLSDHAPLLIDIAAAV